MKAFSFQVQADPVWRGLGALLGALTLTSLAVWAAGMLGLTSSGSIALALLGMAVGTALGWWCQPAPQGVLTHDQEGWSWQSTRGHVRATIDLQAWMLLRFDAGHALGEALSSDRGNQVGAGAHQWLPVARRMDPAQWHALRVAVQARTPDPAASRGA